MLERLGARRGIGFTGKNCCTIDPAAGSWLLLATVLVLKTLTYAPPVATTPGSVSARRCWKGCRGTALTGVGIAGG